MELVNSIWFGNLYQNKQSRTMSIPLTPGHPVSGGIGFRDLPNHHSASTSIGPVYLSSYWVLTYTRTLMHCSLHRVVPLCSGVSTPLLQLKSGVNNPVRGLVRLKPR